LGVGLWGGIYEETGIKIRGMERGGTLCWVQVLPCWTREHTGKKDCNKSVTVDEGGKEKKKSWLLFKKNTVQVVRGEGKRTGDESMTR